MPRSLQTKLNIAILISLIISLILNKAPILIIFDLVATIPVIISAFNSLKNKKVSVDLLASIALFVSIINHEWSSIAFINLMITSARIFQDYTENKASSAIKSLLKLRPEKVKIKSHNQISIVPIENVKIGDIVVIETGDRVPVDGKIIDGVGNLDQSSLTGESLPITKIKGQEVFSSTLNLTGSFLMETQKIGKDTTLEKMISLIENASNQKQGIQGIADKFATIYIILTLSGSIIIFALTKNLNLILSILLVACADDIAVAIPMAFWGAIAKLAQRGVIVKGSEFLEGLSNLKTVIVDKTGTLTKGKVQTQNLICFNNFQSHVALEMLAGVESVSEHPIAKAIVKHAKNDGLKIKVPEKFEEFAGLGIQAFYGKTKVIAGNFKFLKQEKVKIESKNLKIAQKYQEEGFGVVFLGINNKLAAIMTLTDEIRPEARETIFALKKFGVQNIIMLTGDNEKVAARVAHSVGITQFHANLLPENKLEFIKNLKEKINSDSGKIAMIGDGVNDAGSLKLADVGISMGAIGSDAAIEASDIALMQDNLSKIIDSLKISKFVNVIAKENFFIWGIINSIGLFLVFTAVIGPSGAAFWNFITDFLPIMNALRVFRYKFTS